MKVNFYLSENGVHNRVITAMYNGCPEEKKLIAGFKYEPADVGVIFGVYKSKIKASWPRGEVYRAHRGDGADVIVLETGYIKRGDGPGDYYAAGFNGLNGYADFKNKGMPADRAEALGVKLKPWAQPMGGHVVICGQVPWDASCEGVDVLRVLAEAATLARDRSGMHFVYRPHPLANTELPGFPLSINNKLMDDLKGAYACLTFNSNSAVESVIAGTPVMVIDKGSMAFDMCVDKTPMPCRRQWLNDLAYAQWTPQEMEDGKAWRHLFR